MKGSASTHESFTHPNTRSFSGHSVFPACLSASTPTQPNWGPRKSQMNSSKRTVNYRDDRILVWYAVTPSSRSHISEPRHLATKRFFAPFRWWSRSMSNSTTLMDFLSAQVGLLAANLVLTAFCCFCIISLVSLFASSTFPEHSGVRRSLSRHPQQLHDSALARWLQLGMSWLTSQFRTSLSFQPSQYLTGHSDKQPHRHTSDPRHTEIQATTANSYSSEVQEVAWKKYGVEDIPMKQLGPFKNGDYEAQTNRESRWTKRSPAKRSELINPQASAQIWVWPPRKNLVPSKLQQFMSISQKHSKTISLSISTWNLKALLALHQAPNTLKRPNVSSQPDKSTNGFAKINP